VGCTVQSRDLDAAGHSHHFYGRTNVRLLDIPGGLCEQLAARPGVYGLSALLREALLAVTDRDVFPPGAERRLLAVVVDELVEVPELSLHLPEPVDDRLRTVTDLLHADPARASTLTELGRLSGASERTLSRLFHTELGMSFNNWRSVLRVHHALALLAGGRSVTDTATTCGWSNPSSFIEVFTAIVGQTPGSYLGGLRASTT
jgi:AraC-like DNA-binding protein